MSKVFIHVGGVLASSCANAEITDGTISPTVMARAGTGGNQLPLVVYRIEEVGCFQNTGRGWWNEGWTAETLRTPCGGDSTKSNLVAVMINQGTETDV